MTNHLVPLPRGEDHHKGLNPPLATASWFPAASLAAAVKKAHERPRQRSALALGQVIGPDNKAHQFDWGDDRHVVTIAGSRAGKGRSLIIPNLLSYPGSVICIDPKGENAAVTAAYRRDKLGQAVTILDPFGVLKDSESLAPLRGTLNPLEFLDKDDLDAIDQVSEIADALIIQDNDKDPHWNESARSFLKGVILFLMSLTPKENKDESGRTISNWTLDVIADLIGRGLPAPGSPEGGRSLDGLLKFMVEDDAFGGAVAATSNLINDMGDKERGGVLSSLKRHIEFIQSPSIVQSLASSTFNPADISTKPTTVYLVLPEWRMGTHSRWLRLIITTILQSLQKNKLTPDRDATLFIMDEFAALQYMQSIERAAGYIAGFGVKLWIILQDLSQLKSIYNSRWETFLGNAGTITAFGNSDITTLDYLSNRLGLTEVTRTLSNTSESEGWSETHFGPGHALASIKKGDILSTIGATSTNQQGGRNTSDSSGLHVTKLLNPDEIARFFAREEGAMLVLLAGLPPIRLSRLMYDRDEPFKSRAAPSPYHAAFA